MKKLKRGTSKAHGIVTGSARSQFSEKYLHNKRFAVPLVGGAITLFAVVMTAVLLSSFAASNAASIEPETGSPSASGLTIGDSSTASGGKYVRFSPATAGGKIIFSDDFNGSSVDTTKWAMFDRLSDAGAGQQYCYVSANNSVSNGTAKIITKHESHTCGDTTTGQPNPRTMPYTVGGLTQATTPFLYGTIDVRAKMPGGKGLWPFIWMLGYQWQPSGPYTSNTPENQWPRDGWAEIDIAEFWNGARTTVNNTIHYQNAGGLNIHALPFDATSRFMTYRFIWSAGSAIWQVDGEDGAGFRTLYTVTGAANVPDDPMYVSLDISVGGPGADGIDPATFPQTMEIDYVRVTQ